MGRDARARRRRRRRCRRRQGRDGRPARHRAHVSKASPQLLLACASGKHIKSAVLTGRKAGKAAGRVPDLLALGRARQRLPDRRLGEAEAPLDSVSLNFSKIEVAYKRAEGRRQSLAQVDQGGLGPSRPTRRSERAGRQSPYDAVPYPGHPFAQTHPDRLATLATLFGLRPAPPERCRVLELGCGDAGNLAADGARAAGGELRRRSTPRAGRDRARRASSSPRSGWATSRSQARAIEDFEPPPAASTTSSRTASTRGWRPPSRDRLLALCAARWPRRRGLRQLQRAARRPPAPGAARHARLPHRRARPSRASASRRPGRCCASCSRARRAGTTSAR